MNSPPLLYEDNLSQYSRLHERDSVIRHIILGIRQRYYNDNGDSRSMAIYDHVSGLGY